MLPQELIDLIIGYLKGDLFTLKALSTVSQCMVSQSQALLFSSVILHDLPLPKPRQGNNGACRLFYELLKRSPRLASLVKELVIEDHDCERISELRGSALLPCRWIYHEQTLPLVLDTLDNLEKLSMKFEDWETEFDCFPLELSEALERVLSAPCAVNTVEVECVSDTEKSIREMFRLLQNCGSLRHLSVGMLEARHHFHLDPSSDEKMVVPKSESAQPRLELLELGDSTMLLTKTLLDSQFALSLRVLSLDLQKMEAEGSEVLAELWRNSKETLEVLTLFCRLLRFNDFISFDPSLLHSLPHLKRFTLHLGDRLLAVEDLLQGLQQIILTADEAEIRLEKLNVVLNCPLSFNNIFSQTTAEDWISLNKKLTQSRILVKDMLQVERKIVFHVHVDQIGGSSVKRIVDEYFGCGVISTEDNRSFKVCLGQ